MAASQHDFLPVTNSSSPPSATSNNAPRLKLCYLNRAKLFPLSLPHLSFSKLLSLVAQVFPETQNDRNPNIAQHSTASPIELSYVDEDGDTVVIDSEESFDLAAVGFHKTHTDVIKLQVCVKNGQTTISNTLNGSHANAPSRTSPPSNGWQPRIPCRHFQAGRCRFGSSCRFLHNATDNCTKATKPNSLSDQFQIDEWLIALKSASEHDNISYLSSPEGYNSFLRVLSHPCLPQTALHQLVGLLTRPKLRTSLLRQATDKIYNALIGSQLLKMMHAHIRTSVKPILCCIEPYVFLCEELMSRSSDGWKEVPLDELKTLVDEVESDTMPEVCYIMGRLLDHRAKKKRLEAVDEKMSSLSLVSVLCPTYSMDDTCFQGEFELRESQVGK